MDQVKRWLTMSGADPPPADSDNLGGVADVATTTPAVGPDASSSLPRTEGAVDEETPQRRQSGLHKFIARRRESLHNILDGRKSAGAPGRVVEFCGADARQGRALTARRPCPRHCLGAGTRRPRLQTPPRWKRRIRFR